jgi:uncharacterized protein (DUF1778 family)
MKNSERQIGLRASVEDRARWAAAAAADGRTLGNWIRRVCNAATGNVKREVSPAPDEAKG